MPQEIPRVDIGMFAAAVKEHEAKQRHTKEFIGILSFYCPSSQVNQSAENKRRSILKTATQCSEVMLETVNEGVAQIFANEKKIEAVY